MSNLSKNDNTAHLEASAKANGAYRESRQYNAAPLTDTLFGFIVGMAMLGCLFGLMAAVFKVFGL